MVSKEVQIKGIVQGVGFRPFVYSTAKKFNITGWVINSSAGVKIHASGKSQNIESFLETVKSNPPPLAQIDTFNTSEIEYKAYSDFQILKSQIIPGEFIPISPDVSICHDCRRELFDPQDHRYRYPFINCTNCGPRLTIIKDIPYDRPLTTMSAFPMCDRCKTEYENPSNRRFHAQPVACHECGHQIWFENGNGNTVHGDKAIHIARQYIRDGKIIAIKGLGGFHLACNALDSTAVKELRKRKKRSDKPFATMAFDIDTAKNYCYLNKAEIDLLEAIEHPIVITKKNGNMLIPDELAPGRNTIGIMLPYTPLHLLLLEPAEDFPELLVMTSGNLSDEPIAYTNNNALETLDQVADGFLLHNRDIHTRVDDSVLTPFESSPYFFRRARGFAPKAIPLPEASRHILACGGELKNTFCLTNGKYAFMSHHIGDLKNLETSIAYDEGVSHYEQIFKLKPEFVACDLHPEYLSTKYAQKYSKLHNIPLFRIQHHHAHLASCLADNQWNTKEKVIGICLDGTGYGTNGNIWGGEILVGDYISFERKYHLEYMPLPGGDAGVFHPNRIAAAYLWNTKIPWDQRLPAIQSLTDEEENILRKQLKSKLNVPLTSSMGRLFDAVAGLIGLRFSINYEAQAAIELEQIADNSIIEEGYDFKITNGEITIEKLLSGIIHDLFENTPASTIAAKFHNTVSDMVIETSKMIREELGLNHVALSGGVWQNQFLLNRTYKKLSNENFSVLYHKNVPANDGGISLGQAMIANANLKK